MRLRPYGPHAVLVEPAEPAAVLPLATALAEVDGVVEVVPAARTLLAVLRPDADPAAAAAAIRDRAGDLPSEPAGRSEPVVLTVDYDGPDLAATAAELGLPPDELARRHSDGDYVVAFCGFAPGFAYLTGLDADLHVPRLAEPRTKVPSGSVGIAGEFTGVYPRASPGGWRLLGRTDATLWDLDRTPPALLTPGTRVRFRAT
jgi:KipI family sensor histidine kinase inhibitor